MEKQEIIDWIISNEEGSILIVDKIKSDWTVLTILPWGKKEPWESDETALQREIQEELWVKWSIIEHHLLQVDWKTPTSNIQSIVRVYAFKIVEWEIQTNAEVRNPRFVSPQEILQVETITKITHNIIEELLKNNMSYIS